MSNRSPSELDMLESANNIAVAQQQRPTICIVKVLTDEEFAELKGIKPEHDSVDHDVMPIAKHPATEHKRERNGEENPQKLYAPNSSGYRGKRPLQKAHYKG